MRENILKLKIIEILFFLNKAKPSVVEVQSLKIL
jgi:hypothetical protein